MLLVAKLYKKDPMLVYCRSQIVLKVSNLDLIITSQPVEVS